MATVANLLPGHFAPRCLLPAERAAIVHAAQVAKGQLAHERMPEQLMGALQQYHGAAFGPLLEQLRSFERSTDRLESESDFQTRAIQVLLFALTDPGRCPDLLESGSVANVTNVAFASALFCALQALAPAYTSAFRAGWFALSRHRDETGMNAFHPWINRGINQRQGSLGEKATDQPQVACYIVTQFLRLSRLRGGPFTQWTRQEFDGQPVSLLPLERGKQRTATFHFDGMGMWQMTCVRDNFGGRAAMVTVRIVAGALGTLSSPNPTQEDAVTAIMRERANRFLIGLHTYSAGRSREVAALKDTDAWPKSRASRFLDQLFG